MDEKVITHFTVETDSGSILGSWMANTDGPHVLYYDEGEAMGWAQKLATIHGSKHVRLKKTEYTYKYL